MTKEHPRESDVKEKIKAALKRHDYFFFSPGVSSFGLNGVSDILALKRGHFLAVEVKLRRVKGSPLQERFGQDVSAHGGWYRVVNMEDVETGEFDRFLDGLDSLT